MDLNGITEFLENKNILITGTTGFLAKVFVEKILRVQPNVKKLFLLIRDNDTKSAEQRLNDEVIGKELFKVLKEIYGADFKSFVSNKVKLVVGDISCMNLGITDHDLQKQLWTEINIVVSMAATTRLDERYDLALDTNTMGAMHVQDFSKNCLNLEVLLHVSTAYVWGEKTGVLLEKPFSMGETLNGMPGLDIEQELRLVQERKMELQDRQATKEEETVAMKEMGLQRSRFYGWPNTYVFTKSMGEMLLGDLRGNVPLVIMRPTIITSTYKEPFPGWTEGFRTTDSFAISYGKGKLKVFLGGSDLIIDLVPGDMVVNAMIVAIATHANQQNKFLYQLGSSRTNPFRLSTYRDLGYRYFSMNPFINREGKPIKVTRGKLFSTTTSFQRHIALRYLLPVKGLQVVNAVMCNYFRDSYINANQKIKFMLRMVELHMPYMLFRGVFDCSNLESLRTAMANESEQATYYFDSRIIDWEDYFMNTHFPGIVRYVVK